MLKSVSTFVVPVAGMLLLLSAVPAAAQEAPRSVRPTAGGEPSAVEALAPAESAAADAGAPDRLRLSARGLVFIERHEGFVPHLYNDSANNCTIGYGHLLHMGACTPSDHARYPHGITHTGAVRLLRADVRLAERAVRSDVKVRLNQHQFDALVSFTFNIGTQAFKSSTLLRVLNRGHYSQVPAQMMRWVIGGPGLEARRKDEVRLWRYGEYT